MIGWTIYERPSDFPTQYVARKWTTAGGVIMSSDDFFAHADLDAVRRFVVETSAKETGSYPVRFPRSPQDDAVILETWL